MATLSEAFAIIAEGARQDTQRQRDRLNFSLALTQFEAERMADEAAAESESRKQKFAEESFEKDFDEQLRQYEREEKKQIFATSIEDMRSTNKEAKSVATAQLVRRFMTLAPADTDWEEAKDREKAYEQIVGIFGTQYGSRIYGIIEDSRNEALLPRAEEEAIGISRELLETYNKHEKAGLSQPEIINAFGKAGIINAYLTPGPEGGVEYKFGLIQNLSDIGHNEWVIEQEMNEFRYGDFEFDPNRTFKTEDLSESLGAIAGRGRAQPLPEFEKLLVDLSRKTKEISKQKSEIDELSTATQFYTHASKFAPRAPTFSFGSPSHYTAGAGISSYEVDVASLAAGAADEHFDEALVQLSQYKENKSRLEDIVGSLKALEDEREAIYKQIKSHPDFPDP